MRIFFFTDVESLEAVPSDGCRRIPQPPTRPTGSLSGAVTLLLVSLVAAACQGDPQARIRQVRAWSLDPSEPHKARIRAALGDKDRDVRAAALSAMLEVDPASAQEMARTALTDPDGLVRAAAVRGLPLPPGGGDVERLCALANADPAWQVRAAALEALVPAEGTIVAQAFVTALDDTVKAVRKVALDGAKLRPGTVPVERLARSVVEDPEWDNRVAAAEALGASGTPEAYAALDAAAGDGNEFVRATAAGQRRVLEQAGILRPPPPPTPEPTPMHPKGV